MADQQENAKTEAKSNSDSDEDGNDALEESPCGRWQKRREKVPQRDIPGIDVAYLAMDNELGVEVVWNEVEFSERKNFRAQEEKIKEVFDHLMKLDHVNLVKFHKYWMDPNPEKPRVIFITEYMSSGSMSNFLKRTRKGNKTLSERQRRAVAWKKWCTQILTALNYLHSCEPPIVHGNLTCNTIFIQHNGLIKIGCVAPEAIHQHVKTFRENVKNMHYIAPETTTTITPAIDIYAFGICALEVYYNTSEDTPSQMNVLGFQTNGGESSSSTIVTQEIIDKTIQGLEDPLTRDFIRICIRTNPAERWTARQLLFHPVLFEVHSLKLLAAHVVVNNRKVDAASDDDVRLKDPDKNTIVAEIVYKNGRPPKVIRYSEIASLELVKLLEDVRNGIYPLTAFAFSLQKPGTGQKPGNDSRVLSPADQHLTAHEQGSAAHEETGDEHYVESRRALSMAAEVKAVETNGTNGLCMITISIQMDDKSNRHLTADIGDTDTPELLANELVHYGFINHEDRNDMVNLIATTVLKYANQSGGGGPT